MERNKRGQIEKWYDGKNIFITGSTGFMGKILIEKILRSLPKAGNIYLLVRSKYGVSPKERINTMFKQSPLFRIVREQNPEAVKKIHPLHGDLTVKNMGLSSTDLAILEKEVSIVFHLGATLKLEADLRTSVNHNTKATKNLLDMCTKWQQLQCFIHVSTAFCYPEITELKEQVYPSSKNPYKLMEALDILDDDMIEKITPPIITNHANTYIFTKRITESIILDYKDQLPICIVRPSIVTPTILEPFPGWVDSLNGPVGVLVGAGKGVIRTMICNEDAQAEIIPVDCAIKAMLVIAYTKAKNKNEKDEWVYNITQGKVVPITWEEIIKRGRVLMDKYPFDLMLWRPGGNIHSSRIYHNLIILFQHYLPAYFVDLMMHLSRNKPFLVRVQHRISLGLKLLEYFTTKNWSFHNDNILNLENQFDNEDRKMFQVSKFEYDIDEYLKNIILGCRLYCIRDPLETLPRARRRLRVFKFFDVLIKIIFIGFILYYLFQYLEALCPKFNK